MFALRIAKRGGGGVKILEQKVQLRFPCEIGQSRLVNFALNNEISEWKGAIFVNH